MYGKLVTETLRDVTASQMRQLRFSNWLQAPSGFVCKKMYMWNLQQKYLALTREPIKMGLVCDNSSRARFLNDAQSALASKDAKRLTALTILIGRGETTNIFLQNVCMLLR
jgi:hypothetical protein